MITALFSFVIIIMFSMKIINLLKRLDLLKGDTALDVGARDCRIANELANIGYRVDAVDIKERPETCLTDGVNYIQSKFEDFQSNQKYNLIVASNIIPFLTTSIQESLLSLSNLLASNGILYFTVFGREDGWADEPDVKTIDIAGVHKIALEIGKIVYESEERYKGKTYSGKNKNWHIITMVVTKG